LEIGYETGKIVSAGRRKFASTMSEQSQLFDRAAQCERLMNLSSDPVNKQTLKQLRDMWIALANESTSMSVQELAKEIISIEAIQSGLETKPALQ
jgi:hypothetical protein